MTAIRYIVCMGVSGSGKSTLGHAIAERMHWPFVEGDDLHPDVNVEKMRHGVPLDDADRRPWLEAVARTVRQWRAQDRSGVISCSALRRAYRDVIADGHEDVLFVYLHCSRERLAQRLADRRGHFMSADLLDSQLATLEAPLSPPERALRLEIERPAQELVRDVVDAVSRSAVD
ncbi:gluconokinase [Oleiagrimonas soli]|uniref:Gluconokinase n=1 Tax=Oleiagrimonas soli TaxID=1543381 RepID=A0A099CWK8_9GAMM|nr:gluconokinase [Oleiagrimonas soli]KGI78026.1 hypothetical protein LF63_0106520 [Oleiagrimonas soli]MBB6183581.1 gluconokinase [Oleiagrimonas soli]